MVKIRQNTREYSLFYYSNYMKIDLSKKYQVITALWDISEIEMKSLISFTEKTLLYFYPKDDTPGCTLENKDFSCFKKQFDDLWIMLIWVSRDSIESHAAFIEKHDLWIDLISDPELLLHKELWAYWEKNNYGKIVEWVIRSTFLVNTEGQVLKTWKWIRAKGHAARVMKELTA